jgi:hypothetical protein
LITVIKYLLIFWPIQPKNGPDTRQGFGAVSNNHPTMVFYMHMIVGYGLNMFQWFGICSRI